MRVAAAAVMVLLSGFVEAGAGLPFRHTTLYWPMDAANAVDIAVDSPRIAAGDVQLIEDGKAGNHAESIREFRSTGYGVSAVLAIDASAGVKGSEFESVKAALRDFVSSSRPQDRIAVVAFADSVDVKQAFTSDKDQLMQAIGNLRAGGKSTLLNQAILNGLSLLAADKTNARRHLLVITDGKNDGTGPDSAALESEARQLDIAVDCLGVARLPERFLLPMQSLVTASGGAYMRARGYESLRTAIREGIEGLLGSPVLRFRLAHIEPDGRYHQLQLSIVGGATETVRVFLPRVPTPIMLYVAVAVASVLFGGGFALILYSRLARSSGKPESVVHNTPVTRARPKTVYSPPPAPAPIPPAVAKSGAEPRLPIPTTPAPSPSVSPPAAAPAPIRRETESRQIFTPPAPGHPTAWLRNKRAGARFAIEAAAVWIGTADGNNMRVTDTTVSRNHACIQWLAGDLYLFDNHSTNGTSVNGRRMESGSRVRLQPGDEITIGQGAFSLEM
jgi:hypothetical protein